MREKKLALNGCAIMDFRDNFRNTGPLLELLKNVPILQRRGPVGEGETAKINGTRSGVLNLGHHVLFAELRSRNCTPATNGSPCNIESHSIGVCIHD
jgi:hypothetical protein